MIATKTIYLLRADKDGTVKVARSIGVFLLVLIFFIPQNANATTNGNS